MGNVFSGVANAVGGFLGGGGGEGTLGGIAGGFTPQNHFQGTSPLDVNALSAQLAQSQGNLGQVQGNQGALAAALLAQSQGQGPNPAQAQLNQQTNQNIQQNAGLIASQKGINPALATRLAAQNAANMSQQAAGQGAVLGAQQQLAAQGNLANVYGQQANQNLQNASMSGQLANQSSLGSQQLTAGVNAQNAAATQNTQSGLLQGVGGGIGGLGAIFKAHGGAIPHMSDGGTASMGIAQQMLQQAGVPYWQNGMSSKAVKSGSSDMTSMFKGMIGGSGDDVLAGGGEATAMAGGAADAGGVADLAPLLLAAFKGGPIPKHLHPVAQIYHPNFQAKGTAQLKSKGGNVPGKAKVKGDSIANDTVKTMLSPGEVVIPKSIMESKDPVKGGAEFIANELKKQGKYSDKDPHQDFQSALKEAVKTRKSA